jgi:RND family efflux transporter MFP subunit
LLIFGLLNSLLLVGCSEKPSSEIKPSDIVRPAKVVSVKATTNGHIRRFPATIEPSQTAQLAFRVNGEVQKLFVLAGQEVAEGQLLAKLDDTDFKLAVKQAEAKYQLTLAQFNRSKRLFAEKLIASSQFDEAQALLDIDKARLEQANTNLAYTELHAPFTGMIAQLHIEAFEFVQAKQPIMQIQGREQVDVAIEVSEQLMVKMPKERTNLDYQPTLVFEELPDVSFKVSLKEFDIAPSQSTKTYKLIFTMPNPEEVNLLTGMTGTLIAEMDKVLGTSSDTFVVPASSVFVPNESQDKTTQYVYKLNGDNRTVLVAVEIIALGQQDAEIRPLDTSQLSLGDKIVATGSHYLTQGQKVIPWVRERGL